jgi:hypothetical protein
MDIPRGAAATSIFGLSFPMCCIRFLDVLSLDIAMMGTTADDRDSIYRLESDVDGALTGGQQYTSCMISNI